MKEFKITIHFLRLNPSPDQEMKGSFNYTKRALNRRLAEDFVEREFDKTYKNVLKRISTEASSISDVAS
jgi:hypothetical protein